MLLQIFLWNLVHNFTASRYIFRCTKMVRNCFFLLIKNNFWNIWNFFHISRNLIFWFYFDTWFPLEKWKSFYFRNKLLKVSWAKINLRAWILSKTTQKKKLSSIDFLEINETYYLHNFHTKITPWDSKIILHLGKSSVVPFFFLPKIFWKAMILLQIFLSNKLHVFTASRYILWRKNHFIIFPSGICMKSALYIFRGKK